MPFRDDHCYGIVAVTIVAVIERRGVIIVVIAVAVDKHRSDDCRGWWLLP